MKCLMPCVLVTNLMSKKQDKKGNCIVMAYLRLIILVNEVGISAYLTHGYCR